jgi:predicted aconitase with swiveling domain
MKIKCRKISKGVAEGLSIVSHEPISFFGNVNPNSGIIIDKQHSLFNKSIEGKILVFPTGKGSTVGSYTIYQLNRNGKAPKAMIMQEAEPIVAVGAIISDIPTVDKPEIFNFKDNQVLKVDANNGWIKIK